MSDVLLFRDYEPVERWPKIQRDEPCRVVILPIVRIERRYARKWRKGADDDGLPSDSQR